MSHLPGGDPAARRGDEIDLVAAQRGDKTVSEAVVAPWRRELHAHCHRTLGSLDDAGDAR